MNSLAELFSSNGLMPHGFCYQWKSGLIWLHAVSDVLIALAYVAISVALIHFMRRRRDIPFGWMFVCFGVFIAACGGTHFMELWTLWVPSYWFAGGVKAITAVASVSTAVLLVQLMPDALTLPSPEDMRAANEELRRQESILRKSEERFRQMAENVQEIFWTMDPHTKEVTYVSPAFEQICEFSVDYLYTNPTAYRELIHPEDRHQVLAGLEKLESTNRLEEEFRIICPGGAVKWLRALGFTAKDSAGAIQTFVGTVQEITARKVMEVALRESEDLFRDLVEHSSDLVCTYNLDGQLLSVNEKPAALLGYSREELLEKPMREFLLPEGRVQFDESLQTVQKEGFVQGLMVVLTKTGERRTWEYHNTLRTDGVRAPLVRGVAHDVTEQKRAEKALRLSEEKFSKAFLASPYALIISTIDEGTLMEVNDSFLRIMGFSRDEVIGRTSFELGLWTRPADREAILRDMHETGRVQSKQIIFQTRAAQPLIVNYSAEIIEVGRQRCLLSVCEDITERTRAEERLREAQARIESVLNSVADVHALFDTDWRYLYVNEAAVRAVGRPRQEILKCALWEVYPDVVGTEFERQFRRAMNERIPIAFEFHYQTLDTWWENRLYPVTEGLALFATEITERKRAEEELRRLSGELLKLQDQERRTIARDLHDATGQDLVALATNLAQLHALVPSSNRRWRKLISQCQAIADRSLCEVRTLSYVLHPPMLDEAGLEDALRHFTDGFGSRTGIKIQIDVSPNFGRLPQGTELALFRVVQEGLVNIQRHSGSQTANIQLKREREKISLQITDTGRGLAAGQRKNGIPFNVGVGIRSMEERVNQVGGFLAIESSSTGTMVCVTVPEHA